MTHSSIPFPSLRSKTWSSRLWLAPLLVSLAAIGACSDDDAGSDAPGGSSDVDSGHADAGADAIGTSDANQADDASDTDANDTSDASDTGDASDASDTTDAGADTGSTDDAGDAGDTSDASDAAAEPTFSDTKLVFTADVGTGPGVCYDIDTAAAVDCESAVDAWDLMFEVDAASHSYNIWTNGGVKGTGKGASFGPMSKEDAEAMASSKDVPGWFADYFGGTFVDFPWYAYDVLGTHDVSANGRVYVVDTGTDKYRVQLTSYYGAGGASGMVTLRYGKLTESTYDEVVLDATAGGFGAAPDSPANKAAYFDLDTGTIVDVDDTEARSNTVWDIAVKRFNVTLNGGASGPGTVKAAIADERDALYDANGDPIKAQFEGITADAMKAAFEAVDDATGLKFAADKANTYILNDGSDKSWFGVNPPPPSPPTFFARPENWWAIRSAGGDSYAKIHVTDVVSATRSFTIELFVQPKAE